MWNNVICGGDECDQVDGVLPGLAGGGPSVMMQSNLDFKTIMSFPAETATPAGLFPNFNTMNPVQKAVINHTFGVAMVPKNKQGICCNICLLRFNSDSQAEAHYKGSRHAKKLKAQENEAKRNLPISGETNRSSSSPAVPTVPCSSVNSWTSQHTGSSRADGELSPSSPPSASPVPSLTSSSSLSSQSLPPPVAQPAPPSESEEDRAKKLLYCSLCKVAVNSLSQLDAHNTGSKHRTMLEARSGSGPIKAFPRPGAKLRGPTNGGLPRGSGLQNKTFHCQICDVHVNSEIQLKQHISSRRHKDRVAGKPTKPKYSPYNKQQHTSTTATTKLVLQKELVRSHISPAFVSPPFCPPSSSPPLSLSASSPSSSLSLHARPTPSLFPPSFLRAAPGPIRSSQGSILFSPY